MSLNGTFVGFRPIDQGIDIRFIVDSGNGSNMFVGDLVSAVAAGAVNVAAAGDANIVVGAVLALFDSNGVQIGTPQSSVSTKYLPASTAGYALVACATPGRRFVCQSNTIITDAARMATTDHVATAGNTTMARSGHVMNAGDLNTGGQMFIIGPETAPGNDITAANAGWVVIFNEGFFMGTGKSTGV